MARFYGLDNDQRMIGLLTDSYTGLSEIEAFAEFAPSSSTFATPPTFLEGFPEWIDVYESGSSYHEQVRNVLGPEADRLTDAEVDAVVGSMLDSMSAEGAENFWRKLGGFAQKALPFIAKAAGTVIGGPVGAKIGGMVGNGASRFIGNAMARGNPQQHPQMQQVDPAASGNPQNLPQSFPQQATPFSPFMAQPMPASSPNQVPVAGATPPGLSELMALLSNPQLHLALSNAALGGGGAISGAQPFSGMMDSLANAATRAAAEAPLWNAMSHSNTAYAPRPTSWAEQLADSVQRQGG